MSTLTWQVPGNPPGWMNMIHGQLLPPPRINYSQSNIAQHAYAPIGLSTDLSIEHIPLRDLSQVVLVAGKERLPLETTLQRPARGAVSGAVTVRRFGKPSHSHPKDVSRKTSPKQQMKEDAKRCAERKRIDVGMIRTCASEEKWFLVTRIRPLCHHAGGACWRSTSNRRICAGSYETQPQARERRMDDDPSEVKSWLDRIWFSEIFIPSSREDEGVWVCSQTLAWSRRAWSRLCAWHWSRLRSITCAVAHDLLTLTESLLKRLTSQRPSFTWKRLRPSPFTRLVSAVCVTNALIMTQYSQLLLGRRWF